MQGTLENAILAGADMLKGKGMHDALLYQNWEKTQYRAADWLSDWAAQQGRQDAEDWKTNQKKEGILGLAWLGLSKAGSLLSGAWDSITGFFSNLFERQPQDTMTALQRQKDIEQSGKMWKSGAMQKEVDKNIIAREAKYVKEIQDSYTNKDIRQSDDNDNNIKEYNGNSKEMYERLMYYEAKLRTMGVDNLATLLQLGIPVVIGEEGKGAGLTCTDNKGNTTGDTYNDRMSLIYTDGDGNIRIEEYNRANVDVSVLSGNGSVSDGGYDFIVGMHGKNNDFKALNVFSFDNYDKLDTKDQKDILNKLKSNTLTYDKIKNSDILRLLPALGNKTQIGINVHGGTNSYTDSKGCFTIYGMDWGSSTPQKDYKKFIDRFNFNQLGKIYIIR
ncbi:MAG TPA: hypothetical protein P5130_11905 [Spirochaetota bacterium]|nr:hypothetical protein [Spirochaetota bacterium]HOM87774.1 hypothetical protein [Spirochaetota bacterium]HPD05638.1 hypothetical protein [Spirochaetota bacterium]HQG42721.1 hypothetical protein [Spirochaetota bacterium]HRV15974.1 hypothetical protein [Spirochaetota bacterium]